MSFSSRNFFYLLIFCVNLSFLSCKGPSAEEKPEETIIQNASEQELTVRIKELSRKIEENPKQADLYFRRAKVYEAMRMLELAKDDIENAIVNDTTKVDYYIYAGQIYEKLPYTKGALLAYEEAVRKQPGNKELLLKLGEMFYYVRNREKSFQYLNAAIKIDKYMPKAYYYRGMNFKEMEQPDLAIRSFQTAVEADPAYFDAYLQLGYLYGEKKDAKAAAYYNNALNVKPESVRALYARGMYYQSIDSNNLAIHDYEKILTYDDSNKNAHYNLGYNYYLLKNYQKSVDHFSQAIDIDNKYAEAYYDRSISYEALGKKQEAQKDKQITDQLEPLYDIDPSKVVHPGEKRK